MLAAAKICVLENDEDLDDFVVEINILAEISHNNVIKLYEAFFYQNKLWVRIETRKIGTVDMRVRTYSTSEHAWPMNLTFLSTSTLLLLLLLSRNTNSSSLAPFAFYVFMRGGLRKNLCDGGKFYRSKYAALCTVQYCTP